MEKTFRYLFGPVPSRRLGRSLGVDLIPFKTCTLDCSYCQLGKTPTPSDKRDQYVPIQDVLNELQQWKEAGGEADHITLAGSGEPTLHTQFGKIFEWTTSHAKTPSVLLTNGTLLFDPAVRADAALASKVKITLSAWDEASFQKIHNPAAHITFKKLIEGEEAFRQIYTGELSIEVFIIAGINDTPEAIDKIRHFIERIQPDRIDLNTAVRPPAYGTVHAVSPEKLAQLAQRLGPKAEVTASFKNKSSSAQTLTTEILLGLIKRHPATAQQLATDFNTTEQAIQKLLAPALTQNLLDSEIRKDQLYYFYRTETD